jgi:endonuclease/exonuclease/phosphatase family metal-dependent hydrolase
MERNAVRRIHPGMMLALGLLLAVPAPAHALRVVTWNLLHYNNFANTITQRQPAFRTVMAGIGADVVITQELNSVASRDSFLTNVLNVNEPGQWTGSSAIDVNAGEFMAVFWKPSKVDIVSVGSFLPPSGPRRVLQCVVKPVGYLTNPAWFRLYSVHLKAGGPGTVDSTTRRLECGEIRNTLNNVNQVVVGPNFLIGGDMNLYGSYEGAYQRLTESQADNDGRTSDPLPGMGGSQNWHVVSGWSPNYTQAPCSTCPVYSPDPGFSGGGLDDRFDLILPSTGLANGEGLDVHAYFPYGNDGNHYNQNINAPPNTAVGQTIADALWAASDHLPVVMDLRLPSRVSAVSQLNFPTVIQGAAPHDQNLTVNNAAAVPGDDLDYSLSVAAPYSAPPGSFSAAAGAGNLHTLSLSTATAGSFATPLTVATDDPDSLNKTVLLSGRVLRHAVASLDSQAVVTEDTLKFGSLDPGLAIEQSLRVHDQGFDALQAQLSVLDGQITGPDAARFAILGGFTPTQIGGLGHTWTVSFDSTGAAPNTTYEATLIFSTADEPLPGGVDASDLVLHLVAGTQSTTGVPGEPAGAPLSFAPPRPNPLRGSGTEFQFGLPKPARVSLAVYDASGRRVASLIEGERAAGVSNIHWNGRSDAGVAVPAGLYFVRFATPGLQRTARLVVLP